MTHVCVMSSHKPIRIYMEGLILGVNTLYRLFCFVKLFPMIGIGLTVYNAILSQLIKFHNPNGSLVAITVRTVRACILVNQEPEEVSLSIMEHYEIQTAFLRCVQFT